MRESQEPSNSGSVADSGYPTPLDAARATKGPDQQPRVYWTWADTTTQSEMLSDWPKMQVGQLVRTLEVHTGSQAWFSLGKLQPHWWQACDATMRRTLGYLEMP